MKNFISVILPTYNNGKVLYNCLDSIFKQNYKKFEVIIIDGGSSDNTLEIAKKFKTKILKNPYRIEEKGRVIGIKAAKGDIICLIDADNILQRKDWFSKVLEPFKEKDIVGSESLYYEYRKKDTFVTKYNALIGGDDALAVYLGIFDRWNYFENTWTRMKHKEEDKGNYLKIKFDKQIPAMGCNGFMIVKNKLKEVKYDPFVHTDVVYLLSKKGYSLAKVKISMTHIQQGIKDFFKKKTRRIKRRTGNEVKFDFDYGLTKKQFIFAFLRIGLILPILYDTIKGFIRKPSLVWLFHPIAVYGTLFLYIYYNIKKFF
ncbi:MAG: glycosyltransferase family 2 protein [Candidatus Nanoarchaeia archaeon]|nr:glycosyltransferase family 2 protein [Candidatus Nanoarchaeia archaeon]